MRPAITFATVSILVMGAVAAISSAQPKADSREQALMIESCAVCHGDAGQGLEARSAPRLAGLDAAYLERQLMLYANGSRGTAKGENFGPQMRVIAQSLSPADRKAAAVYYAGLRETPVYATIAADTSGKNTYETCASCHGEDGKGIAELNAPRIAGQADWYVLASVKAYRSGARGFGKDDMPGQQMATAAQAVDQKNLPAIAAYVATIGSSRAGAE